MAREVPRFHSAVGRDIDERSDYQIVANVLAPKSGPVPCSVSDRIISRPIERVLRVLQPHYRRRGGIET